MAQQARQNALPPSLPPGASGLRWAPAGGAGAPASIYVSCVACGCRLQMPAHAPSVACPRCTMVTQAADPRAKASFSPNAPSSIQQPQPALAPEGLQRASAQTEEAAIEEAIRRSLGQPVCIHVYVCVCACVCIQALHGVILRIPTPGLPIGFEIFFFTFQNSHRLAHCF